jgi:hypothetical protein
MTKQQVLDRLNELTKTYSFIYILSRIVVRDFCGPIDVLFSKNTREHLNNNEFAFLVGLWIKNVDLNLTIEESSEPKIFDEVYYLMEKLHFTFMADFKFDINSLPDYYKHFSQGSVIQEMMFYAGTGAYDKQYTDLVTKKYKYDLDWLKKVKGFDLNSLPAFYDNIKDTLQAKLNSRRSRKYLSERAQLMGIFCLSKNEITRGDKNYREILEHLQINLAEQNNRSFNDIGDFNIYSEKPIIKIADDSYFIPSAFILSESLYESPYYWMLSDKDYINSALRNRGKVGEEITKEIIEPLFGNQNIYQNIVINKTKNDQVTDVDLLAIHNDKAIIFQVKAKKLTALSKKGNRESIVNDFTKAVKNAYDQAILSRDCLIDYGNFKFPQNDEKFISRISKIKEYLIVTIVLDDYPAITHQVHILLGAEIEELPVAINIFDLALLAKYLKNVDRFIDYISKRIQYSKYFKADNEMAFLGFHLNKGLKKYDGDLIYLDESWAQSIDRKFHHEVYKTKYEKEKPKKMQRNDVCFCHSGLKYKRCHGK